MEALLKEVQKEFLRSDIPVFRAGDTINVSVKIIEGTKERIQQYEGIVIQRHGSGTSETVTVRKISNGVGVERIFPIHAPTIDKIEVTKLGDVRQARIYYMRQRFGKKARIKERAPKGKA